MLEINCPNCNAILEFDEELLGENIECPSCHKHLLAQLQEAIHVPIPSSDISSTNSTNSQANEHTSGQPAAKSDSIHRTRLHDYFCGRLFITLIWFFAAGILIYCFFNLHNLYQDYREGMAGLNHNQDETENLLKLQNDLVDERAKMVTNLTRKYNEKMLIKQITSALQQDEILTNTDVISNGFPLNQQVKQFSANFSLSLTTLKGIEQSLHSLQQIQDNVATAKRIFKNTFISNLTFSTKKDANSITVNPSASSVGATQTSGIVGVHSNEINFFAESKIPAETIEWVWAKLFPYYIQHKVQGNEHPKQEDLNSLNHFLLWLHYVENRLLDSTTIDSKTFGVTGQIIPPSSVSRPKSSEKEGPNLEGRIREAMIITINSFDNWIIDDKIEQLSSLLQKRKSAEIDFLANRKSLRRMLFSTVIKEIIYRFVLAFLALVIADYLKAHFDIATGINLRKI